MISPSRARLSNAYYEDPLGTISRGFVDILLGFYMPSSSRHASLL